MSNLRQKEKQARHMDEQKTTAHLLEETNKKLDTLIQLFKNQAEKDNSIHIQTVIDKTQQIVQPLEEHLDRTPDFIPTVDISGMKTSSKKLEVKKRSRDLNGNLKKLQDLQKDGGNNDGQKER